MPTALVRAPGPSFSDALTGHFEPDARLDPEAAGHEHAQVLAGLEWLGFDLQPLEGDFPDGCFVEDHAVIAAGRALLCTTGAPSRRAEARSVHDALRLRMPVVEMEGRLDGGDVLVHGQTILVGQGLRSDASGLAAVRVAFPELEVLAVPVPSGTLHLKCLCSAPGDIVLSAIPLPIPARRIPLEQAYAANAVGLGDRMLVAEGYPAVLEALSDHELRTVRLRELRKADGSLTCLSLRWG